MSTHENTASKQDVYRRVTDAIVTAIEQGAGEYRMPWVVRQDKGFSPISIATVKPYRGINTVVLWAQAQCKGYTVFNREQVDGVNVRRRLDVERSTNERIARAEAFFGADGVQVRDGGNRAFYRPDTPQAVYMPDFQQFPESQQYYSVLAHE